MRATGIMVDVAATGAVLDDKPAERPAPEGQQQPTSYAQAKLADMVFRAKLRHLGARHGAAYALHGAGDLGRCDLGPRPRARRRDPGVPAKDRQLVRLPMPADLVMVVDALPAPRGTGRTHPPTTSGIPP